MALEKKWLMSALIEVMLGASEDDDLTHGRQPKPRTALSTTDPDYRSWQLATVTGRIQPHFKKPETENGTKTSSRSSSFTVKSSTHRNPTGSGWRLFTHTFAKNTRKMVMSWGVESQTNIVILCDFRSHPPKTSPTDLKQKKKKNQPKTEHWKIKEKKSFLKFLTSLHFQCDTSFQHTLNFTFSSF